MNDDFVDREFMESFFGHLNGIDPASPRITLSPNFTSIIIVDNDDRKSAYLKLKDWLANVAAVFRFPNDV